MPVAAVTSLDGPRVTMDSLLKNPLVIPQLILDMTKNEFIIDAVLRSTGDAVSGSVMYSESTPLFADAMPEIRAEFAEVPVVPTSTGIPRVVGAHERALAIMVSDRMRRRQVVDPVIRQLTQAKNTMVWSWNSAFYSAVTTNAGVQTLAVSNTWASSNATIRADILNAVYLVENAAVTSPVGVSQPLGFEADTLIINHATKNSLMQSSSFAAPYIGNIANESLQYTGKLPNQILDLDVLVSRQIPTGNAIVMQRKRAGFISDELPGGTEVTPLYRDEPRKAARSDILRSAAVGLDEPLAVVLLSGV